MNRNEMTQFLRGEIAKALAAFRRSRDNHYLRAEVIARRQMLGAWDPSNRAFHGKVCGVAMR